MSLNAPEVLASLPADVVAAVARSFGCAPASVTLTPDPYGRGRMSQSAYLTVPATGGGQIPVFAKWPSPVHRVRRTGRYSGAYEREVRFYLDLAGQCAVRTPRPHFASYEPQTGDFVLLLEQLPAARKGDLLSSSPGDVERIMRAIARLHAQWAGDAALSELGWLPAAAGQGTRRYTRMELDRLRRAAAKGQLARRPVRAVLPLLTLLSDRLGSFFGWSESAAQTLVHGDLHPDQALFTQRPEPVLVDWQLVHRGHPGLDVARVLALGLSVDDRRRHEGRLLDAYCETLEACGAPAPDLATRTEDLRHGLLWSAFLNAVFYLATNRDSALAGTEGFHDVAFDRIAAAAQDHGLPAERHFH